MFELSDQPIDAGALRSSLCNPEAGALVTFEGWVRNHHEGRAVTSLEYEAHAELAVKEAEAILQEAQNKFKVQQMMCIHRVGHLEIGALAVWIGVTGDHRDEAFQACRYVIDELKGRVPIWKKEHYREGDSSWIGQR